MASPSENSELRLQGIGVSPGIARAQVQFVGTDFEEPEARLIAAPQVEQEKNLLQRALTQTREQIRALQEELDETVDREHASIFDAHLLVLEDATVIDEVIRLIENDKKGADHAYWEVIHRYLESLRKIPDPYLRERAIDIEDVARRVLRNLKFPDGWDGVPDFAQPSIIFAHDLRPSETVALNRKNVLGFATEAGSQTSHTAIRARSLNIPAVVALHHEVGRNLHPGDEVLLDGYHGLLIVRPNESTLAEYNSIRERQDALLNQLREFRDRDTVTADGKRIVLSGNIEFIEEIPVILQQGAEGVGLYRTEFFYLNTADMRSEERQAENYSEAAKQLAPHEVIIRTLDIGGDKLFPEHFDEPEPNPFLGWRGIRVSVDRPEVFKTQLRAILRASAHGKVGLMYPFISSLGELTEANRLLDEAKLELHRKGIAFDEEIEVGAMIEIPSAVLIADALAEEVDFFSIGTNDLIQYTTAVDRVNDRVASRYQPTHPAVLKLIRETVAAAHRHGIWAGVCGEFGGDVIAAPLMVGARIDELSVGAAQILRIKRAISCLDSGECEAFFEEAITLQEASDVYQRCREIAESKFPELLD